MKLHNYFRSSASYRVRIALNLKSLTYDYVPVHLTRDGGEQFQSGFALINPAHLVPVLEDEGHWFRQSLAILEYLDERFPASPLLPAAPADRAYVRQLSLAVACDIHPLNNLRVLKYLTGDLGVSEERKLQWVRHWIELGFVALEVEVARSQQRGRFCFGDTPTMADCCLVPQMYNAQRFGVDLSAYPTLYQIEQTCSQLNAFKQAHPAMQPDAAVT